MLLAEYHGVAADAEQIRHECGLGSEPFDEPTLLLAARRLGLKAKLLSQPGERIDRLALPALALKDDGTAFVIARVRGEQYLVHDIAAGRPAVWTAQQFVAHYEGRVLAFASRASLVAGLAKFDFTWFIPAVVKYRKLLLEVLVASQRNAQMALRSPANGTVQQLAVHTVGVVVTPAQPLLSVVPEDESLEIEVTILNKDIGFIRSGQDAVVKVDSSPYTRYGHIEGRVENVSHDAIQDEKLGLVYQGRVALAKNSLLVDGTKVKLTPGMSLSVEIKTDRRRVIDYPLLSPLQQEAQESMRER